MDEKYGYVLLKCDGTVEVIECELSCDCRSEALLRKKYANATRKAEG